MRMRVRVRVYVLALRELGRGGLVGVMTRVRLVRAVAVLG